MKKTKKEVTADKLYEGEAAEFLLVIGKWVELKQTFPSPYKDILEATRKFLVDFKEGKVKLKPKKTFSSMLPVGVKVPEED